MSFAFNSGYNERKSLVARLGLPLRLIERHKRKAEGLRDIELPAEECIKKKIEAAKSKHHKIDRCALEMGGIGLMAVLEQKRCDLVHPEVSPSAVTIKLMGQEPILKPPIITPHSNPTAYNILSHLGNAYEGFVIGFLTYQLFTLYFPKVPDKVRLAIAITVANAVVFSYELYKKVPGKPIDYWDILGGTLGTAIYAVANRVIKPFSKWLFKSSTEYMEKSILASSQ